MKNIATLLLQIALIAIAIFSADALQSHMEFIPKFIISLPEVEYSRSDFWHIFEYFVAVHAAIFLVAQIAWGRWLPANGKRAADEVFTIAAGFAVSSLLIFVTSSVAFDPNLMVGIFIIHLCIVLLVSIIVQWIANRQLLAGCIELFRFIFKRLFSVVGVLILMLAVSPGIMAKLFVSDRDFANAITQARIFFSRSDTLAYTLYNPFGDTVFQQPMMIRESDGDQGFIYVLERAGVLSRVKLEKSARPEIILDISEKVGDAEVENGALGFAFPPSTASTEKPVVVYIYYTSVHPGTQTNILSRFSLDGDSLQERSQSEQVLLSLPRENSGFHNGGSVEFDNDGLLYLALGEGVHPKGQTAISDTLRGGIIRLDIMCIENSLPSPSYEKSAIEISANYCIPASNPFIGNNEVRNEYWALGLRNPFRISFDSSTGSLWVGDVGSTKWEEVNLVVAGGHYEFPFREGYEDTGIEAFVPESAILKPPLYSYIHTAFDRAVIGGMVYRGEKFPALYGQYVFADNYSSKIFSMTASGDKVDSVQHLATANQYAQRGVSSVTELSSGDIAVTTLGRSSVASGEILFLANRGDQVVAQSSNETTENYSAAEIRQLFNGNCARCHGMTGKGDGPDSLSLGVPVPDFSDPLYQNEVNDQYINDIIAEGGYAKGKSPLMPAWSHILSAGEIAALTSYIRELESSDKEEANPENLN